MVTMTAPLSAPRRDETARLAIRRAEGDRDAPGPLMVPIAELCGEQLLAAFLRTAGAWFTGERADAAG